MVLLNLESDCLFKGSVQVGLIYSNHLNFVVAGQDRVNVARFYCSLGDVRGPGQWPILGRLEALESFYNYSSIRFY